MQVYRISIILNKLTIYLVDGKEVSDGKFPRGCRMHQEKRVSSGEFGERDRIVSNSTTSETALRPVHTRSRWEDRAQVGRADGRGERRT